MYDGMYVTVVMYHVKSKCQGIYTQSDRRKFVNCTTSILECLCKKKYTYTYKTHFVK